MRLSVWASCVGFFMFTVALYAQVDRDNFASEGFAVGALMAVGVQVVVLLAVAARLQRWISTIVDARLVDDQSAFGKHRLDQFAHEPMRRQIVQEIRGEFDKLNTTMATMEKHHRDEMRNMTELVKPIIEQNKFMTEVMAAQMRRRPASEDDSERGR